MILFALGCIETAAAQPLVSAPQFRMQLGDGARWLDPTLDDTSWPMVRFADVPDSGGIVVLRGRLRLDRQDMVEDHPIGIYLAALAACELAWDGTLIGSNGQPGATAALETPGQIEKHWVVPNRLATAGDHLVALRCSAHHRHFHPRYGYWDFLVGDYDALLSAARVGVLGALTSLSGMLVVGVFALFMFLADRRDRSFLLLAIVCLCGGLLLLAESWRALFGYGYNWHFLRLLTITALTAFLNLAIVGFVVLRYPGRHARSVLLALIVCLGVCLMVPTWDGKTLVMFIAGLVLSIAWTLRAVWRRQRGAIAALVGLVVTLAALVWHPFNFTDFTLYIALDFLLACLLVAHTIQLRHFRLVHEQALVKSARLESELLRKHIQPHFLMNTLTALSEWIEQEPAVAVGMIESISDEFRILARIADRPLIELGIELDLCRSHVAIMSRRRDRDYEFEVAGVAAQDLVPPALFHTLVENAITHDDSEQKCVTLRLTATPESARVRYVFEAPGDKNVGSRVEGTGLRYIRARLQESFGDDWSLVASLTGSLWRTEIVIPRRR
ncbi:MAG: histidine kinase [Dokdonella sp.]